MRRGWIFSSVFVLLAACRSQPEETRGPERRDASEVFVVLDAGRPGDPSVGSGAEPDAAIEDPGPKPALVINEVLYDFASPTTGDDRGREMIELAGPPGTPLGGLVVTSLDRSGAILAEIALPDLPMPESGFFVLGADSGRGTEVDNADQVAVFQLADAAGAIQLVGPSGLVDAIAWGDVSPGLRDATRGLLAVEGSPRPAHPVTAYPAVLARDEASLDRDDNALDFHEDPSPSPGAPNAPPRLMVLSVSPKDALLGVPATLTLRGSDFSDGLMVRVGDAEAGPCVASAPNVAACPVTGVAAAPARVDVRIQARGDEQAVVLASAFTWTTANNDVGAAIECDYCVLQYPETLSARAGVPAGPVYGRIFEAGKTDTTRGGAASGVIAELGFGPAGTNPAASNLWTWTPATFNLETGTRGNDDEYQGLLTVPEAGAYLYTMRFSLDGGLSFTYVDRNGAGSNSGLGFNPLNLGELTVR